jgi:hypothetical protein
MMKAFRLDLTEERTHPRSSKMPLLGEGLGVYLLNFCIFVRIDGREQLSIVNL